MEFLLKQNMEKAKPLEEKKEHELDIKDRMTLLNKQMDETFVNETYTHFLNSREHILARSPGCSFPPTILLYVALS